MDLGAYLQIEDLENIAKLNGIHIPRIRGYRLMKDEKLVSIEEIRNMESEGEIHIIKALCQSEPFWNPYTHSYIFSNYTDYLQRKYLIRDKESSNYIRVNWSKIHGWKRKIAKFEIKKYNKKIRQQFEIWNKYVGREDVLYIHSRIGGNNWKLFEEKKELLNQPWFLERVDDYFDSTYCDFYAKIDLDTVKETLHG